MPARASLNARCVARASTSTATSITSLAVAFDPLGAAGMVPRVVARRRVMTFAASERGAAIHYATRRMRARIVSRASSRASNAAIVCILVVAASARATATRVDARARSTMASDASPRSTLRGFVSPRSLVFGEVAFERDGDEAGDGARARCCARVTCEAGGETHAVRLCDDSAAPIRRGAAFDRTTTKQFGFGIARPISGERVVVDVEADARGCEVRDRTGRGWRSEAVATSNAHRAKSARVARRGRGERWRSAAPSSELVTTVVSVLALVCVNAVLGMCRRRWGKKGAEEDVGAEAPAMDRREWGALVGEDKVKLIEKIIAHQEERVEGLASTAEWTIRARAEAVDYAAPGKNTGDLVYDLLTATPGSIAPKIIDREWSSDSEDADESWISKVLDSISAPLTLDYSGRSDDSQFTENIDLFGNSIEPGRPFVMRVHGHGESRVAKRLLCEITNSKHFSDTNLNFCDHRKE